MLPRLIFALTTLFLLAGCGQSSKPGSSAASDRAGASAVVGKIKFHQKGGSLTYEVVISNGVVTAGIQHFANPREPVANLVGGWFDAPSGRLCLLVQASKVLDEKWRSQAQHFRLDSNKKTVTLEHVLYDYGRTLDPSMMTEHVLDEVELGSGPVR
jgi:hypothetical protein